MPAKVRAFAILEIDSEGLSQIPMHIVTILILSLPLLVLVFIMVCASILRYNIRRATQRVIEAQATQDKRFWEIIEPLRYKAETEADGDKVTGDEPRGGV